MNWLDRFETFCAAAEDLLSDPDEPVKLLDRHTLISLDRFYRDSFSVLRARIRALYPGIPPTIDALPEWFARQDDQEGLSRSLACFECAGDGFTDVDGICDCPHCSGKHECAACGGAGEICVAVLAYGTALEADLKRSQALMAVRTSRRTTNDQEE